MFRGKRKGSGNFSAAIVVLVGLLSASHPLEAAENIVLGTDDAANSTPMTVASNVERIPRASGEPGICMRLVNRQSDYSAIPAPVRVCAATTP